MIITIFHRIKIAYQQSEICEVLPLLQKYDSEIIRSFQILYNTGNDLTDAILSDKQKNEMKILKSHLRVRLQMCLPTTLKSAFYLTI